MVVSMYWKGERETPAGYATFGVSSGHEVTVRFDSFKEAYRMHWLMQEAEELARKDARAELMDQIKRLESQ